jgi:hypothetical protein
VRRTCAPLQLCSFLVLLRHKRSHKQQGQRGSASASAAAMRRWSVAMEFGTWRSGRKGGSCGLGTAGNGRCLEAPGAGMSSSPFRRSGTRKRRCTAWRDGGSPASRGLRNGRGRLPVSIPDHRVRCASSLMASTVGRRGCRAAGWKAKTSSAPFALGPFDDEPFLGAQLGALRDPAVLRIQQLRDFGGDNHDDRARARRDLARKQRIPGRRGRPNALPAAKDGPESVQWKVRPVRRRRPRTPFPAASATRRRRGPPRRVARAPPVV